METIVETSFYQRSVRDSLIKKEVLPGRFKEVVVRCEFWNKTCSPLK
jgi:hypothetical protein